MQIFWTILSGVLVFLIGQAVLRFFLDPLQEFRRTISEIALALIEYANVYGNPGLGEKEELLAASRHIRNLSSKLHAQMYLIPKYHLAVRFLGFPSEGKISDVASDLIGISNSVFATSPPNSALANVSRANRIRSTLGIYIPEEERDDDTGDSQ